MSAEIKLGLPDLAVQLREELDPEKQSGFFVPKGYVTGVIFERCPVCELQTDEEWGWEDERAPRKRNAFMHASTCALRCDGECEVALSGRPLTPEEWAPSVTSLTAREIVERTICVATIAEASRTWFEGVEKLKLKCLLAGQPKAIHVYRACDKRSVGDVFSAVSLERPADPEHCDLAPLIGKQGYVRYATWAKEGTVRVAQFLLPNAVAQVNRVLEFEQQRGRGQWLWAVNS